MLVCQMFGSTGEQTMKFIVTLTLIAAFIAGTTAAQAQTTESLSRQITKACKLEANKEHPECIKRAAAKQRAAERKAARDAAILQSMAR